MADKSRNTATAISDHPSKLSNSLSKKSLFERQKAEAEAKRQREEKETAAVYQDFVKSFDHDDDNDELLESVGHGGSGRGGSGGWGGSAFGGGGGGLGKRHFTSRGGKNSGPGSLGPGPGTRNSGPRSLGPAHSGEGGFRGQKRPFNEYGRDREPDRDRSHGMFSYSDHDRQSSGAISSLDAATAFRPDESEDHKASIEKTAPKPTLHLASLPPGTSPAFIKSLIPPSSVAVENVRILPNNQPGQFPADRKSTSAIVTLPTDTPATDIDTLVSQLQNKYLGFGFYLSISRHLSSAALGAGSVTAPTSSMANLPFGARAIPQYTNLSRGAPPPGLGGRRGNFGPPASYTSSTPYSQRGRDPPAQVTVHPPSDLKQLKLIHLTLEALLTHGPEFEALLMSRREVQRDSKWAWLWDARSAGGVYYRWRLWAISTDADLHSGGGGRRKGANRAPQFVFENSSPWIPPPSDLRFEYTTKMEEFIEDEAYDSSDEEDYDDDARNQRRRRADQLAEGMHRGGKGDGLEAMSASHDADGTGYLNPLSKAKLIHLLARLPDSNTKLRRGDVARVTAFAIEHAGDGAAEVAAMITANLRRPLCYTSANPEFQQQQQQQDPEAGNPAEKRDTTPSSLVALYVISDILMSSTTSDVRHAWRYRALFEAALKQQRSFEYLGRLDREMGWGRLKAEKWKRSVQGLLGMWEGWCVFQDGGGLGKAFVDASVAGREGDGGEEEEGKEGKVGGGKWKSVEERTWLSKQGQEGGGDAEMKDVDGTAMLHDGDGDAELDGAPMPDDDDDDVLMGADEELDGEVMLDSSDEEAAPSPPPRPALEDEPQEQAQDEAVHLKANEGEDVKGPGHATQRPPLPPPPAKRQRPKAVDMFADESDDEQ